MPDPYFCKLYVDTDEEILELQGLLKNLEFDIFNEFSIEIIVYRNEDFKEMARGLVPYSFIECSRYYVEVGTLKEVPECILGFQSAVATLVSSLRNEKRFITVSCDFEDIIVNETGWNWTRDTPEPPERTLCE